MHHVQLAPKNTDHPSQPVRVGTSATESTVKELIAARVVLWKRDLTKRQLAPEAPAITTFADSCHGIRWFKSWHSPAGAIELVMHFRGHMKCRLAAADAAILLAGLALLLDFHVDGDVEFDADR